MKNGWKQRDWEEDSRLLNDVFSRYHCDFKGKLFYDSDAERDDTTNTKNGNTVWTLGTTEELSGSITNY